jgi:ribosome biogenesis protein ERB1
LDTPNLKATFSSSFQENSRLGADRVVSPSEASLFRGCNGSFRLLSETSLMIRQTQRYVRVYHLLEQKLLKTLMPGSKWISCMDVHPSGSHLIVGGYDRKLCWFDLELSDKPYKVLRFVVCSCYARCCRLNSGASRYHSRAIRSVHFHLTYPLFASSSDDGSIQIFHARVFSDLMTDPLIVPLKILRGHTLADGLGVLQVRWCNKYPWLVSAGADGNVGVWCS